MNYAPSIYVPPLGSSEPLRPLNGAPTRARDVLEADRALTSIVCGRPLQPTAVGYRWEAGTYSLKTLIPAYTEQVGFGFLATGDGSVVVTTPDDAYDGEATISVAASAFVDAAWIWMLTPKVVTATGAMRALDVTDRGVPYLHRFDFTVAGACLIWAVQVRPLPRGASPLV